MTKVAASKERVNCKPKLLSSAIFHFETRCIQEIPKWILLQTVKTEMKCCMMRHFFYMMGVFSQLCMKKRENSQFYGSGHVPKMLRKNPEQHSTARLQGLFLADFIAVIRLYSQCQKVSFFPKFRRKIPNFKS